MKTKRNLLTLLLATLFTFAANAQEAYETIEKWDKTNASCLAIKVNASVNNALKTFESLLKSEGLKGKKSGKTLRYEKTVFPAISTEYINLYVKADAVDKSSINPVTNVHVFVSKGIGNDFVSSANDATLVSNLKTFLNQRYSQEVYNNVVKEKIGDKNKEIKGTSASITSLEKTIQKRTKDIEKAEKEIEKAKKDIEKAKKELATQQEQLQKQEQELKDIK